MKIYLVILLIGAILLTFTKSSQKTHRARPPLAMHLEMSKKSYFSKFSTKEIPHLIWNMTFGTKEFIRPKLKKTINDLRLNYIFSLSGLQLTSLLFFPQIFFRRNKKIYYSLLSLFFLFPVDAFKRLIFFRILLFCNSKFKLKANHLNLFFFTFLIFSYQLFYNPFSYIFSFLFIGTIITLKYESRLKIILGISATQILIGMYTHSQFSIIAQILNIPLIFLIQIIHPILLFTIVIHRIIFIDPSFVIKLIVKYVFFEHTILKGTFYDCSLFLLLSLLLLMGRKYRFLGVFLILTWTKMSF